MKRLLLFIGSLYMFSGCLSSEDAPVASLVSVSYFIDGLEEWEAEYADYEEGLEDSLKFDFKHGSFYAGENTGNVTAALITGYGTDSSLFMYMKQQIRGLEPEKTYKITIATELYAQLEESYKGDELTNTQKGSFLKIGAFTTEPNVRTIPDPENADKSLVIADFDKGSSPTEGGDLTFLGKIQHTNVGADPIVISANTADRNMQVVADIDGKIWILIGIDSNLPIYQTIYYSVVYSQFE